MGISQLIKIFQTTLFFALSLLAEQNDAYAQQKKSYLQDCSGKSVKISAWEEVPTSWTECTGTIEFIGEKNSSNKYVGEFKDGKAHGQGTYTWGKDSEFAGHKYVGEYKDGKQHGQGTHTWTDGSTDVGEWKDGKPHGKGTATRASGLTYVAEYKDGEIIKYTAYSLSGKAGERSSVEIAEDDFYLAANNFSLEIPAEFLSEFNKEKNAGRCEQKDAQKVYENFVDDLLIGKTTFEIIDRHCPKQINWSTTGRYSENREQLKQFIIKLRKFALYAKWNVEYGCSAITAADSRFNEIFETKGREYADALASPYGEWFWELVDQEIETPPKGYPQIMQTLPFISGRELDLQCDNALNFSLLRLKAPVEAADRAFNSKERKEKRKAERF